MWRTTASGLGLVGWWEFKFEDGWQGCWQDEGFGGQVKAGRSGSRRWGLDGADYVKYSHKYHE